MNPKAIKELEEAKEIVFNLARGEFGVSEQLNQKEIERYNDSEATQNSSDINGQ